MDDQSSDDQVMDHQASDDRRTTDVICTCAELTRPDGEIGADRFVVAPLAGGGWTAWGVALARLLGRLADGPTQCVIASQHPGGRYVQWMIGHRWAYVEVSSNHYLTGDHRLGSSEERHLRSLGFRCAHDEANWSLEIELDGRSATGRLGTLLTHLSEDIALFDPRRPITIEQFLAAHPCEVCTRRGHERADETTADGRTLGPTEERDDTT